MSSPEILPSLGRLPLLTKVCLFSFGFTFFLAVAVVSFQANSSLLKLSSQLDSCITEIVEPKLDKLGESLWKQDTTFLETLLSDVRLVCPTLTKDKFPSLEGEAIFFSIISPRGITKSFGTPSYSNQLAEQSFPLSYWRPDQDSNANAYWLGELTAFVNYQTQYDQVLSNLLQEVVRFFLISLVGTTLGYLLGYKMIISRIRNFITQLRSDAGYDQLKEYADQDKTELSSLWQSIIGFREKLDSKRMKTDLELKRCQQALQKSQEESELKSLFLAKMSHELRTPMNGLLGFSTLLLESKLGDEQREYAQTIQASLESLLYVVNDVLDLSRIESGDLNITPIPFSIRSVISGVTALIKNRAEAKGLEFETRIGADVPDHLRGDPVRIRQIIMNLAANAIRHTEKGFVLISVMLIDDAQQYKEGKINLRISLEDSGLAIQKRNHKQTSDFETGFSSEFRGKRSLGLDICYQLAELMDSQLCHESKEKGGTSYWFDLALPFVDRDPDKQLIDFSALTSIRVLVIDSYELSRKITLELLEEWHVKFEAVSSASEALKLLQQYPKEDRESFNMILCDDLLQDLSGIETCQRLRQVLPSSVPIVVLCSNPQLGDAEGFFLSGANGFLSKQFRDPYLKSVICQAFAERHNRGIEKRLITRYTVKDIEQEKQLNSEDKQTLVLIVESNIINQQLIMNMLDRNGYKADLASNGFEAIELFKTNRYELIFMDCAMPDMDGFETTLILREIEKTHGKRKRIPIIAMTNHELEGETDRCFKVGMDEIMTKPIKIAKLEMVLSRFIH